MKVIRAVALVAALGMIAGCGSTIEGKAFPERLVRRRHRAVHLSVEGV